MIELIALAALCGAAYLGLRRPSADPIERADPRLSPYIHY